MATKKKQVKGKSKKFVPKVGRSNYIGTLYFVQREDGQVLYTDTRGGGWLKDSDPMKDRYIPVSGKEKRDILSYVDPLGKTWETV